MQAIKELYAYREMIYSMIKKELRGKYKGSFLGFLWTFINPLLQLVVYTIVFSVIMRAGIENFYMFLFVALVPWMFFASSVTGGATSVVYQSNLIKKIYFPRMVLPISYVTAAFVNMLLSFVVIFFTLIVTRYGINFKVLWYLPIVMLVEYILSLGIAMLMSALTVYIRDLEFVLGIVIMAWMYWTPVVFTLDMVPESFRFAYNFNPMTSIVTAYRDILYYKQEPQLETLLQATLFGLSILIVGCLVFEKLQRRFVEEL